MTLAIAHRDKQDANIIELDCLREWKPRFNPTDVISEAAKLLRSYKISKIYGDHYGGEWCRQPFREHGITYEISEQNKGTLYINFLPLLNAKRVKLLDHQRLVGQLCSLERRTSRGGKDSIDHPQGGHDDCANSTAGVVCLAKRGAYLADLSWVSDSAAPDSAEQERRWLNSRMEAHIRATSGYWLQRRW
jgi:hypothetical protein